MKNNYFLVLFAILTSAYSFAQSGNEAPKVEVEILPPISICNPGDCTQLTAEYFVTKPTTNYNVTAIAAQNIFSFTGGIPLIVTTDDVWSPEFTLPFTFNFYGQSFTKVLVGSNGVITFDIAGVVNGGVQTAGGFCPWSFGSSVPNTAFPVKNAIYGVFQDTNMRSPPITDPTKQNVNYYVGGTAPNRYFVTNFNRLPQFSCNGTLGATIAEDVGLQTSQIVIYETTNIIDVYIQKRSFCGGWNAGNGVVGVQNQSGTAGKTPPGRNSGSANANWNTTDEAYRFTPSGAGTNLVTLKWTNPAGEDLGSTNPLTVCITDTDEIKNIIAEVSYTNGPVISTASDDIDIQLAPAFLGNNPLDISQCTTQPVNINQDDLILAPVNAFEYEVYYFTDETAAITGANSQALTPAQVAGFTAPNTDPITIYASIVNTFGNACAYVRPFIVQIGNPSGTFSYPPDTVGSPATYCFNSNTALAPDLVALSSGGTYTVIPAIATGLLTINETTGVLNLTGATPGTYQIRYTIPAGPAPDGCPEYITSTNIIIESCIDAECSNSGDVCVGTEKFKLLADYTETSGSTTSYEWKDNAGVVISNVQNPVGVLVPTTAGTYTYSLVVTQNGTASQPFTTVLIVHPLPIAAFVSTSTTICTNASISLVFAGTAGAIVNFTDGTNPFQVTLDASGNGEYLTDVLPSNTTFTLVDVTGTTVPACSALLTDSILISVGLPTASIIQFTDAVICSGTETFLEIQGTPGATITYTKDGVDQPTVVIGTGGLSSIPTGNQTVAATSTFTYALTNVQSNSSPPCSDTLTGQSAVLTVNALPEITSFQPLSSTICEGTSATLKFVGTPNSTITFNDGTQDLTVLLDTTGNGSYSSGPISATTTFTLVQIESTTNAKLCSKSFTGQVLITIDSNISIANPPTGSGTICIGGSNEFTIVATGANPQYQWYLNGTEISGATQVSYTLNNATVASEGNYTVKVTGSCGLSITSDPSTLILTEETKIITPPVASTTLCVNQALTLSVGATGDNLSYQWFRGTISLAGQNADVLNISSVTSADAGNYTVVISNSCQTVTSTVAELIVNKLPQIVTGPQGTTICEAAGISLTVAATGTGITYQWLLNGNLLVGEVSSTYTDASVSLAEAGNYTVTVSGACAPEVSATAVIVVNQKATFVKQPEASTIVCSGTSITLEVETTGGNGVTYQWFKGTTPIPGATSDSYSITAPIVADSGNYTCAVTVASCGTITSDIAVVIINQAPAITSQPQGLVICVGQTATFNVIATGTNLTYQWFKGATAIAGETSISYTIPNTTELDSGNFYCIITSASCPDIQSDTVTLLVKPLPFATIIEGNPSEICAGESTQVIFNGTAGAVVTYTINGGTPETITLNAGVATILPTGILNKTAVYELVSVTYTGPNACSQNLTGAATVTVNPLPKVTLVDGKICVDPVTLATTRNFLLDTGLNEADYTFEWFDSNGTIDLATNSFYEATVIGQYGVTITDIITRCQATAYATVGQSSAPTDFDYTVSGFFADNPTVVITAVPAGNYEYQLDFGPFQDSNIFDNITAGTHTITVRDPEACDVLVKNVLVVDYPRYFTPNGDGINDTWTISSIDGISITNITIFDRFGRLLKEMNTSGLGWDGNYNGKPLPATDYWFTIKYQEDTLNKEYRAHFSLKR